MKVSINERGKFTEAESFLKRVKYLKLKQLTSKAAEEGLALLKAATPVDTGRTQSMWRSEISIGDESLTISWCNDNVTSQGDPIIILLQYGHGNGRGGYTPGRDIINPAVQTVYDKYIGEIRKEMQKL